MRKKTMIKSNEIEVKIRDASVSYKSTGITGREKFIAL
jgi:hypothetical protein